MHSSAIIQNILDIALETAEEYNANNILEIKVKLGKLNWINQEKLKYIFEILSKGTLAENADLIIDETDVKIKCFNCDYMGLVNDIDEEIAPMVFCPKCGSHRVNILEGYDLNLKNITIEKP